MIGKAEVVSPEIQAEVVWDYLIGNYDPTNYKALVEKVLKGKADKIEEDKLLKGIKMYPGFIQDWGLTPVHVPELIKHCPDLLCELIATLTEPDDIKA